MRETLAQGGIYRKEKKRCTAVMMRLNFKISDTLTVI